MKSKLANPGEKRGKWILKKGLAAGGNGEVWLVTTDDGQEAAMKFLHKVTEKAYQRFRDEITVVMNNHDVQGIMPIWDSDLPELKTNEAPWYVMPKGIPLLDALESSDYSMIVNTFAQLAETLQTLHSREIKHRDIKPNNLFLLEGKPVFGDFGLVDYPDKRDITAKNEPVGPKWTMAPEMKRDATNADAKLADIYSLGKTMWIFLTRQGMGFDGHYVSTGPNGLQSICRNLYCGPLDALLNACTDDDPKARPTAKEFQDSLLGWLATVHDYQKRNPAEWKELQRNLFPKFLPARTEWKGKDSIADILSLLGLGQSLNHTFFPDGGGFDLVSAKQAPEPDCIEIQFDGATAVLKPKRLIFESFGDRLDWTYFRLEADDLIASGLNNSISEDGLYEDLIELRAGGYEAYDPDRVSGRGRRIVRYLRGAFVMVHKTSVYNQISSTYDGRHNKMSADEFRAYMEALMNRFHQRTSELET